MRLQHLRAGARDEMYLEDWIDAALMLDAHGRPIPPELWCDELYEAARAAALEGMIPR